MNEDRTWQYLKKVPQRFHKRSGLSSYQFRINDPWHRPFHFAILLNDDVAGIPATASCDLRLGDHFVPFAVPFKQHPDLFQSILSLGSYLFNGSRVERYLSLFKAYESVTPHPEGDFIAVRHGITHSPSALNRPKTVATLKRLFGTTWINFDDSKHQRIFFQQMAALLMKTDDALANVLISRMKNLRLDASYKRLLHDWEITDAPGTPTDTTGSRGVIKFPS